MIGLLDLVHPPVCLACDDIDPSVTTEGICTSCRSKIRPLVACAQCDASPSTTVDSTSPPDCALCRNCDPGVPTRAFSRYRDPLRTLLIEAKWHRQGAVLPLFADWMTEAVRRDDWDRSLDGWVAIPRDRWRSLRHGVPLSEQLGREVGRRLRLPAIRGLERTRRPPQAHLSGSARRDNLDGTMRVPRRRQGRFAGRRILVVDDVITTGSTLRECARSLRAVGVAEVRAVVLAFRP